MRFEISAKGVDFNERKLRGLGRRVIQTKPAFDRIADVLIEGEQRRFRSSGGWQPLAASTKKRKARQHLDPRILRATGTLAEVLTSRTPEAKAKGQLLVIKRDSVTFGIRGGRTDVYYGRFHQRGQGNPKRVIVSAPTAKTKKQIREILRDHIVNERGGEAPNVRGRS